MSASKALDKAQAIGRQAVTRMMKPPPPPQAAPGSKVVYTDHTVMPTHPNATWDELPPSYRIYPDPTKRWMPVAPADFKFVYWNHIADTPPRTNKGKLSNLLILIPLFWVWWSRKRESEMIGFHRLPPEFGNWWK